jgi:xylulokinase
MTQDEPLLLGIDLGTSAVKVLSLTPSGRVCGSAEEPCPPDPPHPGWLEVPPDRWWQATRQAVGRLFACATAGRDRPGQRSRGRVRAIGLSAAFPTLVLFDDRNQPVRPAILYADQRSAEQAEGLARRMGPGEFLRITGNLLVAGNCTLSSLLWVREREPEAFSRVKAFGYGNSYLALKLTGQLALDEASAPLTGLYDLCQGRWSDFLFAQAEVPRAVLPALMPPGSAVGRLSAEASAELGLPVGIPVAIGSGDTVTSALGAGARPDEPFLTCGSTDSLVSLGDRPAPVTGFVTTGGALAGQWLRIGARSATGAAVSWAAREVLGVSLERFFRLAAEAPAGANGVLFAPHLAGERTPHWDTKARGIFAGLTLATTAADIARAVLEAVSLGVREMLQALEAEVGSVAGRVRAGGGGTRDAFWRQLRADVCGREFLYLHEEETAALGAALLGGVAAGLITDSLALARAAQEKAGTTGVTPDPENARFYRQLADVQERVYPTFRPLMHQLARGTGG